MPDSIETIPAPAPKYARAEAIAAWHDAVTAEQKAAVVKKFPVLREIYAEAHNLPKN